MSNQAYNEIYGARADAGTTASNEPSQANMLDQMRDRLASLSEEARTIRSQVPHEFEPDLERIQAQMQRLGERLSDLGRGAIVPYNAAQRGLRDARQDHSLRDRGRRSRGPRVGRRDHPAGYARQCQARRRSHQSLGRRCRQGARRALRIRGVRHAPPRAARRRRGAPAHARRRAAAAASPDCISAAGALCVRSHRRPNWHHDRYRAVGAARLRHGHQLSRPALCRNRRAHRAVARPDAPGGGAAFARQPLRRARDAAQLGARPRRDARRSRRAARRRGPDRGDQQPARSVPPPVGAPRRDRCSSRHADLAALRRAPVAPGQPPTTAASTPSTRSCA